MVAITSKMLDFFFQVVKQDQDAAKSFRGHLHTHWPGILMEILKTIQEQLIGEKQAQKVLLKEKCIATHLPGIPATHLPRGSKNDRSGSQCRRVIIQGETALPPFDKKDLIKAYLMRRGVQDEIF